MNKHYRKYQEKENNNDNQENEEINNNDEEINIKSFANIIGKLDTGSCLSKLRGYTTNNNSDLIDSDNKDIFPLFKLPQIRWFYIDWSNDNPNEWYIYYTNQKLKLNNEKVDDNYDKRIYFNDISEIMLESYPLNGFRIYIDKQVIQLKPTKSNINTEISSDWIDAITCIFKIQDFYNSYNEKENNNDETNQQLDDITSMRDKYIKMKRSSYDAKRQSYRQFNNLVDDDNANNALLIDKSNDNKSNFSDLLANTLNNTNNSNIISNTNTTSDINIAANRRNNLGFMSNIMNNMSFKNRNNSVKSDIDTSINNNNNILLDKTRPTYNRTISFHDPIVQDTQDTNVSTSNVDKSLQHQLLPMVVLSDQIFNRKEYIGDKYAIELDSKLDERAIDRLLKSPPIPHASIWSKQLDKLPDTNRISIRSIDNKSSINNTAKYKDIEDIDLDSDVDRVDSVSDDPLIDGLLVTCNDLELYCVLSNTSNQLSIELADQSNRLTINLSDVLACDFDSNEIDPSGYFRLYINHRSTSGWLIMKSNNVDHLSIWLNDLVDRKIKMI